MNRAKMHVALGSVFILLLGFSPIAMSESKPADSHAAGAPEATAPSGHLQVKDGSPELQYQSLLDFLKSKPSGFTEHAVLLGQTDAEAKQISSPDNIKKLQKWVETFQNYRKGLASCEINSDKSAQLLGGLLDKLVVELNHVSSTQPADWKVSEKKVLAYIVEIERFLKEKKDKYPDSAKDFEKTDNDLKMQLEKTAELLFGQYHGSQLDIAEEIRKQDAAAQQAQMDQTMHPAPLSGSVASPSDMSSLLSKAKTALQTGVQKAAKGDDIKGIHEETEKAIAALKLRSGKACAIAAAPEKKDEKKETATPTERPDNRVAETKKTDDKKPDTSPTLSPGPLEGNNTTPPGGTPPGTTPPGTTPTTAPSAPPVDTSIPPTAAQQQQQLPPTAVDPGTQQIPPTSTFDPGTQQQQQFDPTGLLQALSNDFNNKLNDLTNGFGNLFRGLQQGVDDLARQQAQAQNDQNNRDDGALEAALKALSERNNEQTQPPPPITPPQISPQTSDSQQPQQQPLQQPPPQDQPPPPPPFNPLAMMPPPTNSAPPPYYPEERSRFDDDRYIAPPVIPVQQFDPMQQLYQMMAMRAITQPQYPPGYGPTANINRISSLAPRPLPPRPGGLPALGGFATSAGSAGRLSIPGARSNTLPAALSTMRASSRHR